MSAPMPNSTINKAVLAITKLQGQDDWPLWSATICVALGQTWAYVNSSKPAPKGSSVIQLWKGGQGGSPGNVDAHFYCNYIVTKKGNKN